MFGLNSYHLAGCNLLMATGSVKFLKASAANSAIRALGSRAQGEVIDASSD